MDCELERDERMEIIKLLPFHGEEKYRTIFDTFRNTIGFSERELTSWDTLGSRTFTIGNNLREQILIVLEEIEIKTPVQEVLYNKIKP